jgi:hypothetical protein
MTTITIVAVIASANGAAVCWATCSTSPENSGFT